MGCFRIPTSGGADRKIAQQWAFLLLRATGAKSLRLRCGVIHHDKVELSPAAQCTCACTRATRVVQIYIHTPNARLWASITSFTSLRISLSSAQYQHQALSAPTQEKEPAHLFPSSLVHLSCAAHVSRILRLPFRAKESRGCARFIFSSLIFFSWVWAFLGFRRGGGRG